MRRDRLTIDEFQRKQACELPNVERRARVSHNQRQCFEGRERIAAAGMRRDSTLNLTRLLEEYRYELPEPFP